jgi:small glutamine-rich tetratricopeptide repeat-containing protein alpha
MKASLATARSRAGNADADDDDAGAVSPAGNSRSPPPAGGNPFAGLGGMGGGGMPDLASLMNNPQMMQMASQMMQVRSHCRIIPDGLVN